MPASAPRSFSSCPSAASAAATDTETALDEAAFGRGENGSTPAPAADAAVPSIGPSREQRRWLLLRAIELMDRREQSALRQWHHYRCPAPATLLAPARGDNGERPLYRLDLRRQRCSCPDQAFCDAFNAKCEAAGLPAWARLCCKHHRIAQIISTWRSEFGPVSTTTQAPPSSCCAAQEEPQASPPPAPGFQEKP